MIPVGRNGKQFHDTEKDRHTHGLGALGGPRKVESKRGILKKTTSSKGSELNLGNNTCKHQ